MITKQEKLNKDRGPITLTCHLDTPGRLLSTIKSIRQAMAASY